MSFRLFRHVEREDHTPNWHEFRAVCPKCGSSREAEAAGTKCHCGELLVADCVHCQQCGGKHLKKHAGEKCACGGTIGHE